MGQPCHESAFIYINSQGKKRQKSSFAQLYFPITLLYHKPYIQHWHVISFLWCSIYQALWSHSQWPSQESRNEIFKLLLIAAVSGVFARAGEKRGKWRRERERERELQNNEHHINAKHQRDIRDKRHRSEKKTEHKQQQTSSLAYL